LASSSTSLLLLRLLSNRTLRFQTSRRSEARFPREGGTQPDGIEMPALAMKQEGRARFA
jgi:hypothetical protein